MLLKQSLSSPEDEHPGSPAPTWRDIGAHFRPYHRRSAENVKNGVFRASAERKHLVMNTADTRQLTTQDAQIFAQFADSVRNVSWQVDRDFVRTGAFDKALCAP